MRHFLFHPGVSATFHNRSRNLSAFYMTVADVADASLCVEQAIATGHTGHTGHNCSYHGSSGFIWFITVRIFQAPKNLSSCQAVSLFSEMSDAPVDKLARWQDRFSYLFTLLRYSRP